MDLQDLSANDFVLPTAVEELRYVDSVSKTGFQLFINAFELLRVPGAPTDASPKEALDTLNKAPETMVALLAAANFARRMALLCTQLSHMVRSAVDLVPSEERLFLITCSFVIWFYIFFLFSVQIR